MIEEEFLIPECYVDTELIRIIRSKLPRHEQGISKVIGILEEKRNVNKKLIGVVDKDKQKHSHFSDFKVVKETTHLILKKHKERKHYLIVICPAIEVWLLDCAKMVEARHDFDSLESLKRLAKRTIVDSKVKNFINTLKQKQAPPMVQINTWIEDILAGKL